MIDILVTYKPEPIEAQTATTVWLIPISTETGKEPLALEAVHTKDMHLIVVSEDLSYFVHTHPEKKNKGYEVEIMFPFAGEFFLFCDIKPQKDNPLVVRKTVKVVGNSQEVQHYQQEVLNATVDDLNVYLELADPGVIKVYMEQNGRLEQNGRPVLPSSLDDYLGAKAHVVMIPVESKEYLHVHPMVHQNSLVLHALFTATGIYRAWIQLLFQGKLYTFDFVLFIKELPLAEIHH